MTKYDDASWHYGGDYPDDLPQENAATHIGMFVAWCIENDFMSEENIEENEEDIQKVKAHKMTGAEFLMKNFDGKFCDSDLSDSGMEFANNYYDFEGKSKFAQTVGYYFGDYAEALDSLDTSGCSDEYESYRVNDSWKNYELIKAVIDSRLSEWNTFVPGGVH